MVSYTILINILLHFAMIYNVAPCCVYTAVSHCANTSCSLAICMCCACLDPNREPTDRSPDRLIWSSLSIAVLALRLSSLVVVVANVVAVVAKIVRSQEIKCHQVVNFVSLPMATTTTASCKALLACSLRSLMGKRSLGRVGDEERGRWGEWECGACAASSRSCLLMIWLRLVLLPRQCQVVVSAQKALHTQTHTQTHHTDTHAHIHRWRRKTNTFVHACEAYK